MKPIHPSATGPGTATQRFQRGEAHEARVLAELLRRDWLAEPFGQELLTHSMRLALQEVETNVRHLPDIIASKRFADRRLTVAIDAKASQWHGVDVKSAHGMAAFAEYAQLPCYFIFLDGLVTTPDRALATGVPSKFGNGNPCLDVPCGQCVPFNTIFGRPE